MNKVLITGGAGFIGYHVSKLLLSKAISVTIVDNFNNYYSSQLKIDRIKALKNQFGNALEVLKADIADDAIHQTLNGLEFDAIVHLAAQAGVRHSILYPDSYVKSNIVGYLNILEYSRSSKTKHLLFASTSSVYGKNFDPPFSEESNADYPNQFYAASKRSGEIMSYSYSSLFEIPITVMRFFTVYGSWGRPDMALYKFTSAILEDKAIDIYNNGNHARSFTHASDVARSVYELIGIPPKINENFKSLTIDFTPYRIVNVGSPVNVNLLELIRLLERKLGKTAKLNFLGLQKGDLINSSSNANFLSKLINFNQFVPLESGMDEFVTWYKEYHA